MRAGTKTSLILGDLLQIPVGLVNAISDPTPKLSNAPAPTVESDPEPAEVREVPLDADVPADTVTADVEPDDDEEPEPPAYTKGVKVGRGASAAFHPIPTVDLENAKLDAKLDAVEVVEFIDYRQVPTDRLTGSFYVQPDDGFARPLRVLMDAMRQRRRAAVVRFMVRDRQQLGVVRVRKTSGGDVLLLNTVAFAESWREPDAKVLAAAAADKPAESQVTAAVSLLDALAGDGDTLHDTRDEYVERMTDLVERASNGEWDDLLDPAGADDVRADERLAGQADEADALPTPDREPAPTAA